MKTSVADSEALRANKLALVERLADDLAHEIKNPLHSMVINLEVLRRRVDRGAGGDPSELQRYVSILATELERVSRRVDLLLRMVRPERAAAPVSLADAVEELVAVVELERERLAVEIELHPPEGTSRVRIPRDSARQIILNLLLLGLDASTPDGRIVVSSELGEREESLRVLAIPGDQAQSKTAQGDEAAEEQRMSAAVRALVEMLGGRLEIGPPAQGPPSAREIIVALPVVTL